MAILVHKISKCIADNNLVFSGSSASYFDNQLSAGTTYAYRLVHLSDGQVTGQRTLNLQTRGTSEGATAAAVVENSSSSELKLNGLVYSRTALELQWDRSDEEASASYLYNVYQDGELVASSDALSFFIDGLTSGQTYRFSVQVLNGNGETVDSDETALTTFAGEDITVLVAQSTNCENCAGVDVQIQQSSGIVVRSANVFEDVQLLGQSVVDVDRAAVQLTRSSTGDSIFISATTTDENGSDREGGLSIVEIDSDTGLRVGTKFIANGESSTFWQAR